MTTSDRVFRNRVRRLHACGPRPLGELLGEVLTDACPRCRDLVHERVERYGGIDPGIVHWLDAADWVDDRDLTRLVVESRQ